MPTYQDWGPEPFLVTTTKSINIAGTPAGYTTTLNIKDAIGLYPQYSQFQLIVIKENLNPEAPSFIVPFAFSGLTAIDGGSANAFYKVFKIEVNGNTLTFPIAFQNVASLSPNVYRLRQTFSLQGLNAQNVWKEISFVQHTTALKIVDDLVLFEPHNITIDHIIGTTLKTREVTLTGNVWNLRGLPNFILSSTDPSVYIEETTTPEGTYQTAFGNGTAVVKITLSSFFNTPGTETPESTYHYFPIFSATVGVNIVALRVNKYSTQILSLSPELINFSATKNATEAPAQNLILECNASRVITASAWLTVAEESILIDGVLTQTIRVVPINTSNQDAGLYTGFVSVTATIQGVVTTKTTVVKYEIIDIADFSYNTDELSFTLDNKQIKLQTYNTDTYIQMETIIQTFDFFTDAPNEYTIREKIGLFKGKASVNIGKTIHKALARSKDISDIFLQYIPANVKINIFENNLADDTTIRIDTSGDLKFIAGLSNNFQNFGFLKLNHLPERVTVNSYKYINYFTPPGIHKLNTYKNGTLHTTEDLLPSYSKTATLKVNFNAFTQGDLIEYSIVKYGSTRDDTFETAKIGFVVFPEGMYSNQLLWEDEFLMKQALECTGVYNLKSNLSFVSQKKYINLVEHLSYLETNKIAKITINTGWLLNTDVDMIESLMRSKKVWINANGKNIFLVPISDSILNTDSERELIDYTLEFQINPTYNEETYRL